MCMGFGCNAVGVTGCKIIDSPRERLIAIITNTLVPCNGRFPTIIALISMFFSSGSFGIIPSLLLTLVIIIGILVTLAVSYLLSKTILKGKPSSFALELPPYRTPQVGKIIVRSVFDRTISVLGRSIVFAVPAGLLIWLLANITVNDITLLKYTSDFLDPIGRIIGLDGVILLAFILALPANEILIPIILMAYMSTGYLTEYTTLTELKDILVSNGWTWVTALCTIIFSLMHWPCATTCITIKKETNSIKWTAVSFFLPAIIGFLACFFINSLVNIFMFL